MTGGTIRFIPGEKGENNSSNGVEAGGGGGGTAILYKAPGAKKIQLSTNMSSNLNRREVRTTTNVAAYPQQSPAQNRFWLRLVRQGNQFIGYTSPNGTQWYLVMSSTMSMNNCIEIGLVLTNNEANSTVSATFANVSFTGGGSNLSAPIVNQVVSGGGTTPDFSIFPNPTMGELMVDMAQYVGKNLSLEVYSLQGQLLQTTKMEEAQSTVRLDLSAYQYGMYLVTVKAEGLPNATKRVVLQR